MPEKKTIERAKKDKREGKAATTQAGEFVREEMEHIRQGKHGARNTKQAIAIGLSKARKAGVELPPPKKGAASETTRKRAERDLKAGRSGAKKRPSARQSKARREVLKREPRTAASKQALSKQARQAAAARKTGSTATAKSAPAKSARTAKSPAKTKSAAKTKTGAGRAKKTASRSK